MGKINYNYKKGDNVICINTPGNGCKELEIGKTYKVRKHEGDFAEVYGIENGFLETCFKKKLELKRIKPLDNLNLINNRPDVNAEKINEIVDTINKMLSILEDNL